MRRCRVPFILKSAEQIPARPLEYLSTAPLRALLHLACSSSRFDPLAEGDSHVEPLGSARSSNRTRNVRSSRGYYLRACVPAPRAFEASSFNLISPLCNAKSEIPGVLQRISRKRSRYSSRPIGAKRRRHERRLGACVSSSEIAPPAAARASYAPFHPSRAFVTKGLIPLWTPPRPGSESARTTIEGRSRAIFLFASQPRGKYRDVHSRSSRSSRVGVSAEGGECGRGEQGEGAGGEKMVKRGR